MLFPFIEQHLFIFCKKRLFKFSFKEPKFIKGKTQ